ncbi:FadR/GntR family transcriptional regulator [Marinobacter fonticola]|uniref:FadR/GntR family transcriptional regulator n=1 Tax=Marinobacter fonticola TaxID=2603215 RepID=UPI0011E6FF5D|nr:FCD domain-containing protein [Marinobacter fonticola]
MSLQKIKRGSLVESAIEDLRQAVEQRVWGVGERLPNEATLAENLGVSRNTVREAVRVLVHVGILETRQGDGTYVRAMLDAGEVFRRIERTELRDQLEVRMMLEAEAARLAAQHRRDQDLTDMKSALDRRAAAGDDIDARIQHDEQFHRAIVAASRNQALIELYTYFSSSISKTIHQTEKDVSLPEPTHADHEHLLEAIRFRDAEAAHDVARALLKPSLDALEGK